MKKGESDIISRITDAYSVFSKLTQTLARDLQAFLILSPAHDISANQLQIVVHMVKVVGVLSKKIEVWATITDTKYVSTQVKILTIKITKENILQIMSDYKTLQLPVDVKQYGELRDIICTQAMTLLLEEVDLRKTYKN